MIQRKIKDGTLFESISDHLTSDMEDKFESFCKNVQDSLYKPFHMIIPDAQEKQKAEERFKEQLAEEVWRLKAKYLEIRFSMSKFWYLDTASGVRWGI
ncbi:hypothetical protein TSTA_101170 [Talaromyces stipitatus ATCC 10500]|uniref:Uncharacterized protein n=1 Tax=Talaromyces stipitatus (strain ATCC 10500 / CBS 375.48 / QM 6759 / NRRL 1006) TaxID=441959 RepID=B8MLV1_TALSN|nr:uncharacterized protein TSTA_101170 [Talaromyces stipitatus ATCC 10500]EED13877.1 hypothetical protein TSTA_101170 [Talaromyces stipitatus ATCC 10500]